MANVAELAHRRDDVMDIGAALIRVSLGTGLAAGRIGRLRYAMGRFSGFKRPRTDVGVTHTDAIHDFDLFAHLLGREATRVGALQRGYLGRSLGGYR